MANNTGYEEIIVGATAVGPTAAMVSGNNSICAIFYVDPESTGAVRYRADQTDPTATQGLPIRPGRHIVVAGKGGIMNAKFVSRDGGRCVVHAMYYDQVDVIAADLGDQVATSDALFSQRRRWEEEVLDELRRIRLLTEESTGVDSNKLIRRERL